MPPALLVGSGPSLDPRDIEAAREAGFLLVGCNDNWVHRPDILYAPDHPWIRHYRPDHPCRWTVYRHGEKTPEGWHAFGFERASPGGLSRTRRAIANHGHAGAQMVSIAVDVLGFTRVALTGYDMRPAGGRVRWRGSHPPGIESGGGSKFDEWRRSMIPIASDCRDRGVDIINCSRETALDCFPRATIEEVIARWLP